MQKMVKGAVALALLGVAMKYGSKHPKWIEYKNKRAANKTPPTTQKDKPLESDVIELGHS